MRLVIEIAAAALFAVCITVTSAAFAAARVPLCRDQAAVRRKVFCDLLWGQAAVGDVGEPALWSSSWRKPGPITPTFKSSRAVVPIGIVCLDQLDLPIALPELQLLLACDGLLRRRKCFQVNETEDAIFFHEFR